MGLQMVFTGKNLVIGNRSSRGGHYGKPVPDNGCDFPGSFGNAHHRLCGNLFDCIQIGIIHAGHEESIEFPCHKAALPMIGFDLTTVHYHPAALHRHYRRS